MGFELFCATLIALIFGVFVCFAGYRYFLFLLPIWGFFFGFGVGAQAVQALLGQAFLGTVTSWLVGFMVALLFSVLSYLFYFVAVTLMAGSLGYGLGVAMMGALGVQFGFLTWLIGIILAVIVAALVIVFNLQKYAIIIATAIGGAAISIGTLMLGVEGMSLAQSTADPIRTMLSGNPLAIIVFFIMALAGIAVQWQVNRTYTIEPYDNRI
ncbi:MAG: DUF4203 domain-containing protein [Caldilineaceae bacterium]|nr:DUF4203 domain-containing protein [Caldilineaceae bacterium]MCB9136829.1 DUF4203 domain-containing protein [Caldilineaceae bacterium]